MTISGNAEHFFGKRVVVYDSNTPINNSAEIVYRLSLDYDAEHSMADLLKEFLGKVDKSKLEALVLGMWSEPHDDSPEDAFAVLVEHAAQLPNFKALFVGDMTYEECEISWIIQGDYSKLGTLLPQLECLRIRGATSLALPVLDLPKLKQLTLESGGLPAGILQALAQSKLPNLEHLELWLGADDYGYDATIEQVSAAVLAPRNPHLRYLGLRDSIVADEVAQWLATQDWLAQLQTLDLSLGNLSDAGGEALLGIGALAQLQRVDLSHHYLSEDMQAKLKAAIPHVVLDDPQEPDDEWRYVAVGE